MMIPMAEIAKARIRALIEKEKPIEAVRYLRFLTNMNLQDARQCLIDHYGWRPPATR